MLLNQKRNQFGQCSRGSVGMVSLAALLSALLFVGFAPQLAVAQDETEPAAETAQEETGSVTKRPASVEARLDRLERMLEGLVESGGGKGLYFQHGGWHGAPGSPVDAKQMARVHKEIERATRHAERVGKEFGKKFENIERTFKFDGGSALFFDSSKPLMAQRKMLEAQRKALEKQLKALDEQLAELERHEAAADEEDEERKQSEESKDNGSERRQEKR